MGARDIPTGKSGIGREESNGPSGVLTWGVAASQKLPLQIDLKDEEDGKEQELRKNLARERKTPARYRANLAIEGSNPRGSGEHHELQTYQETVSGEESELWQKKHGRKDALALREQHMGASGKAKRGKTNPYEVGLQSQAGCTRKR